MEMQIMDFLNASATIFLWDKDNKSMIRLIKRKVTFLWDEGCDRWEIHQCVVVGVEAVVQPDKALSRALSHAVVTGYQDVNATPEAGPVQLRHQQADVVINLITCNQTRPSITVSIKQMCRVIKSWQTYSTFLLHIYQYKHAREQY